MNNDVLAPVRVRVRPSPDDRIAAKFVGVTRKVQQQLKLHKALTATEIT
ncbi:MAG: hypothetical protein RLZZ35_998 [Actinomycetota bacterium]